MRACVRVCVFFVGNGDVCCCCCCVCLFFFGGGVFLLVCLLVVVVCVCFLFELLFYSHLVSTTPIGQNVSLITQHALLMDNSVPLITSTRSTCGQLSAFNNLNTLYLWTTQCL